MLDVPQKQRFVVWKDFYSVGNDELDNHHRAILAIINDLYESVMTGKARQVRRPIFDRLMKYTKVHFAREEELLKASSFPDLARHKLFHEKLTQKTLDLWKQSAQPGAVGDNELLRFLKEWWINHIGGEDKKYSPSLQHLGIS